MAVARLYPDLDIDASPGEAQLHKRAYDRLCEALMRGEFSPGQKLTFRSLAEALGVSVTPVREAVSTLAALGALRVHPKRHIEVSKLSAEAYVEMLELRRLLEGHAAARAAERITDSEVEQIVEINDGLMQYALAGNLRKAMRDNQRFHFAVYRASRSAYLVENIERLWLLIGPSLNLHLAEEYAQGKEVLQSGFENHIKLIDALQERDPSAALSAIIGDMGVSCSHMLAGLLRDSSLSVSVLKELNSLSETPA
ncbi:GntR family transcriptional regulator [Parasphingopyxis marina]|uniref:GntR family transcriptional regulator n=1 Tax=Parasphingopyxis marina TaxID=2761622 RepID=A0A842I466_9SPHN|nr:GntR family transcriptional regulator [Parasphingopyxis marina]MBC2778944.1 GntR family transcriptional regulator [Parasphingopyxis marina]